MAAEKRSLKVFTEFKLPFPSKDFQIQSDYLFKEMKKYSLNLYESFTERPLIDAEKSQRS